MNDLLILRFFILSLCLPPAAVQPPTSPRRPIRLLDWFSQGNKWIAGQRWNGCPSTPLCHPPAISFPLSALMKIGSSLNTSNEESNWIVQQEIERERERERGNFRKLHRPIKLTKQNQIEFIIWNQRPKRREMKTQQEPRGKIRKQQNK